MPGRSGRMLAAVLAAGITLAACSQQLTAGERVSGAPGSVSDQGYTSPDGATTIVAKADRKPVGPLVGETLDGQQFDLRDKLGSVVVVNVWASWCPPCRAEAPVLTAVSKDLADQSVSFVGLGLKDSPDAARAFARRVGMSYPTVIDSDGTKVLGLSADLPPTAIPATIVIDREGRVAARALGEVDESRLRGLIDPVLAEDVATPERSSTSPSSRASSS